MLLENKLLSLVAVSPITAVSGKERWILFFLSLLKNEGEATGLSTKYDFNMRNRYLSHFLGTLASIFT